MKYRFEDAGEEFISCLVSIGSGGPPESEWRGPTDRFGFPKLRSRVDRELIAGIYSNSIECAADNIMFARGENYFRLNLISEQWDLSLDDFEDDCENNFKHHPSLDGEMNDMLADEDTIRSIEACAQELVNQRQARAAGHERWQRSKNAENARS